STCRTPGTIAATSASTLLVARHGWQKAVEKCTSVARSPSSPPMSAADSVSGGAASSSRTSSGLPSRRKPYPLDPGGTPGGVSVCFRSASDQEEPATRWKASHRVVKTRSALERDAQQHLAAGGDDLDAVDAVGRETDGAGEGGAARGVVCDAPARGRFGGAVLTHRDQH